MDIKTRFCKALNIKQLQQIVKNKRKLVSPCKPASYSVLPCEVRALRGGIFCALLLWVMLGFASCSKPEAITSTPIQGGGTAPNQGGSLEIDTTWLPDTALFSRHPHEQTAWTYQMAAAQPPHAAFGRKGFGHSRQIWYAEGVFESSKVWGWASWRLWRNGIW